MTESSQQKARRTISESARTHGARRTRQKPKRSKSTETAVVKTFQCSYCRALNPEKRCACGKSYYCSTNCQKAHWKAHKPICQRRRSSIKSKQSALPLKEESPDATESTSAETPPTETIAVNQPYSLGPPTQPFFYYERYGFSQVPEVQSQDERQQAEHRYTKALTLALGSGGKYTSGQVQWLKGFQAAKGFSPDLILGVESMLKEAAALNSTELAMEAADLLNVGILQKAARAVVYDMLWGAAIQRFPECQMAAIQVLAQELGVDDELLQQLQEQVQLEVQLKQQRLQLLFPQGHPCIRGEN